MPLQKESTTVGINIRNFLFQVVWSQAKVWKGTTTTKSKVNNKALSHFKKKRTATFDSNDIILVLVFEGIKKKLKGDTNANRESKVKQTELEALSAF